MNDIILEKQGANFFGFEIVSSSGKRRPVLNSVRGSGNLSLTKHGIHFKQWLSKSEYTIPFHNIVKVETHFWHNLKIKWPYKVLRIHFKDDDKTKIFGVTVGGKLDLKKGWKDNATFWKEQIDARLK